MLNNSTVAVSSYLTSSNLSSFNEENLFHPGNDPKDATVIHNQQNVNVVSSNLQESIYEKTNHQKQLSEEEENKNSYVPVYHSQMPKNSEDLSNNHSHQQNPKLQQLFVQVPQQQNQNNNSNTESTMTSSVNTSSPLIIIPPSSVQFLNPTSQENVAVGQKEDQFFKTKLCIPFTTGLCRRGECCSFAHGLHQLKKSINLQKTRLCDLWIKGCCPNSDHCYYAHGHQELKSTDDYYKTGLCKYWKKGFVCQRGEHCRHAHGEHELRTRVYRRTERDKQTLRDLQKPSSRTFGAEDSTPHTSLSLQTSISSGFENAPVVFGRNYTQTDSTSIANQVPSVPIKVSLPYMHHSSNPDGQKCLESYGVFDASSNEVINTKMPTTGLIKIPEDTKSNSTTSSNIAINKNSNKGIIITDVNNASKNIIEKTNSERNAYERSSSTKFELQNNNTNTLQHESLVSQQSSDKINGMVISPPELSTTEQWIGEINDSITELKTQIENNVSYSEPYSSKLCDETTDNPKACDRAQELNIRYHGDLHESLAATSQRQYYTSNASILSLIHESYCGERHLPVTSFGLSGNPVRVAENLMLVSTDEQGLRSMNNSDLAHVEQLISSQDLFNPTEWLRHIPSAPSVLVSTAMSAAASRSQRPFRTESIDSTDTTKEFEDAMLPCSKETTAEYRNNCVSNLCDTGRTRSLTEDGKKNVNKANLSEPVLLKIRTCTNNSETAVINNDLKTSMYHPITINGEPPVLASICLGNEVVTDLEMLSKLWVAHVTEKQASSSATPQVRSNNASPNNEKRSLKNLGLQKRLEKKYKSYSDLSVLHHLEKALSGKKYGNKSAPDLLRLITELVFKGASSSSPRLQRNVSTPILGQLEGGGSGAFNMQLSDAGLYHSKELESFESSTVEQNAFLEDKMFDLLEQRQYET